MARIRIGDILKEHGLIEELQVQAVLSHQQQWGGLFGEIALEMGLIDEESLYKVIAQHLGVPLVSLLELSISRELLDKVGRVACVEATLIPTRMEARTVVVAIAVPQDVEVQDRLAFLFGGRVIFELAPAREIEWAIRRFFDGDLSPLPPPRERGASTSNALMGGALEDSVQFSSSDGAPPAVHAGTGQSLSPTPMAVTPSPSNATPASHIPVVAQLGATAADVANLRHEVERLKTLNRAIVELGIRKGLFTADELRLLVEGREPSTTAVAHHA